MYELVLIMSMVTTSRYELQTAEKCDAAAVEIREASKKKGAGHIEKDKSEEDSYNLMSVDAFCVERK